MFFKIKLSAFFILIKKKSHNIQLKIILKIFKAVKKDLIFYFVNNILQRSNKNKKHSSA